jgi:glycosyltransferase involved in cell wall biosynthesis
MYKISVVTPVHNKEAYINKTLDSILSQTYTDFELILVDDGSTDNSGLICDQYALKDLRIKVVHQQNAGVSAARNTGIRAAQYSLIAFIDADDYWDVNFLKEMTKLINIFPDNDIYSAKFARVSNSSVLVGENYFPCKEKYLEFDLIDKCCYKARFPIHTSSVILKKMAIEKAGYYDVTINNFEDYDLFLRIAIFSKCAYLNSGPLSFYNIGIPHETKARGPIPLLSKQWISHMGKFDNDLKNHKNLKLLLDRSVLSQLISYRKIDEYTEEVKTILSKVSKSNYGWKYRIIYFLPPILGNNLINIYSGIINNIRIFNNKITNKSQI